MINSSNDDKQSAIFCCSFVSGGTKIGIASIVDLFTEGTAPPEYSIRLTLEKKIKNKFIYGFLFNFI